MEISAERKLRKVWRYFGFGDPQEFKVEFRR
jgi:hypothetical protein